MSKSYMNVAKFRSFFPILKTKINGYPLAYFDSASTAQVPQKVINAITAYYQNYKANIGRGIYTFAEKSTSEYEQARSDIAKFIGAKASNVLFTSGATASINLVANSWGTYNLHSGDEILVSAVEHHSNFLPWQELARTRNVTIKIIPVTEDGSIDIEVFKKLLHKKTKLVAIVHSSNVTGATHDVTLISSLCKSVGAAILVDACQSVAHQKIDVETIGCDFLVFSGHKLFGPTGVGVLYAASDRINEMRPVEFGGGMVFSVGEHHSEYRPFPRGFEAGTPNISGVIGLGAAVSFVKEFINFDELQRHEAGLTLRMIEGLSNIKGIKIISFNPRADLVTLHKNDAHAHMVTFVSDKYHAHDIAAYLDRYAVAVRAGHHCVQLYHQQCSLNATVRISFSGYNTIQEVDFVIQKLQEFLN